MVRDSSESSSRTMRDREKSSRGAKGCLYASPSRRDEGGLLEVWQKNKRIGGLNDCKIKEIQGCKGLKSQGIRNLIIVKKVWVQRGGDSS